MFDLLAIDWGKKRIGMAFGDLQTNLVLPFDLDLNWYNFWEILEFQLQNRNIGKIILGMPVNFELGKTKVSEQIEFFVEDLEDFLTKMFEENEADLGQSSKQSSKKSKQKLIEKIKRQKPQIIIINERNSSQLSQNFEIIQESDSKSGFRKRQKINQKQNQKWEVSKSNLNHLAAAQILNWYLENL